MKIAVRAKPGVKKEYIEEVTGLFGNKDERRFVVAVRERATEGRANRAIEKAIAEYFKVPSSRVTIIAGHTAKEKIVEVAI